MKQVWFINQGIVGVIINQENQPYYDVSVLDLVDDRFKLTQYFTKNIDGIDIKDTPFPDQPISFSHEVLSLPYDEFGLNIPSDYRAIDAVSFRFVSSNPKFSHVQLDINGVSSPRNLWHFRYSLFQGINCVENISAYPSDNLFSQFDIVNAIPLSIKEKLGLPISL